MRIPVGSQICLLSGRQPCEGRGFGGDRRAEPAQIEQGTSGQAQEPARRTGGMEKTMRHTLSVLVENKFGVLARVAGMFSGRGFNIDTLNVGPTHDSGYSRITATVKGDNQQLDQAIKQLNKLVDVIEVEDLDQGQFAARELVLVKVAADGDKRPELLQICEIFRANIVDVSHRSMIIEMTGNYNKIEAFLEMIMPFGVKQMARTGTAALRRNRKVEL